MSNELLLLSSDTECQFPERTPLTAQRYGCRCNRCQDAKAIANRKYRVKYYTKIKMKNREYNLRSKIDVFNAYGGCKCNCCGETNLMFLSLDHVFNDGCDDRYENNVRCSGTSIYSRLRRQGYPDRNRYQVLCMNCNFGKKFTGTCPHKEAY